MGIPAMTCLNLIPDLVIQVSTSECCGIAGTYGVKREKFQIAQDVGRSLFGQIDSFQPDLVLTDSETCRWWVTAQTGVPSRHPIEILAQAMGILPAESRLSS